MAVKRLRVGVLTRYGKNLRSSLEEHLRALLSATLEDGYTIQVGVVKFGIADVHPAEFITLNFSQEQFSG
ncbi:hypothetical protein PMAA_072130 [Talaromyces marneffei ATCC 18224]|uniref:Uncharacterized protein n=2 Tax=Talaromyces marneffei TaxID=37727 RepID=B6Q9P7_TALMQ|nr:hypothetical protein PMAA_072130 [Talaromyces marneffei ATCC 18224]